jgi:hypothetical protein
VDGTGPALAIDLAQRMPKDRNAPYCLGGLGPDADDALPALDRLAQDPDARHEAVQAIVAIGSPAAIAELRQLAAGAPRGSEVSWQLEKIEDRQRGRPAS